MASYNKNPAALNEPDGIVAVWNLHMLERPEFVFHSQVHSPTKFFSITILTLPCSRTSFLSLSLPSIQTSCLVVPTQGKFFFGIPDLNIFPFSRRRCQLPAIRILFMPCKWLAHRTHTSTDGTVCSWLVDMLAQPQVCYSSLFHMVQC